MTDKEILESTIDLSEACITERQKQALYKILLKYREALSLKDEIGLCPNTEEKLELNNKAPFYIRPFQIKEEEKFIVDREMRKGYLLGILRKGLISYSSPLMLKPRKCQVTSLAFVGGVSFMRASILLANGRIGISPTKGPK